MVSDPLGQGFGHFVFQVTAQSTNARLKADGNIRSLWINNSMNVCHCEVSVKCLLSKWFGPVKFMLIYNLLWVELITMRRLLDRIPFLSSDRGLVENGPIIPRSKATFWNPNVPVEMLENVLKNLKIHKLVCELFLRMFLNQLYGEYFGSSRLAVLKDAKSIKMFRVTRQKLATPLLPMVFPATYPESWIF